MECKPCYSLNADDSSDLNSDINSELICDSVINSNVQNDIDIKMAKQDEIVTMSADKKSS